jgi:hypothetical protein
MSEEEEQPQYWFTEGSCSSGVHFEGEGFINVCTEVFDALAWRDGIAIDGKGGVGGEVIYIVFTSMWEVVKKVGFGGWEGEAEVLALGDLVFCAFSEAANGAGNTDGGL